MRLPLLSVLTETRWRAAVGTAVIRLWDVSTGELRESVESFHTGIKSITYSPDGEKIATGSWDNTVRLWDTKTLARIKTLHGHKSYVYSVAFNGDGSVIG